MPSSNIVQMVSVHCSKGLQELYLRSVFKRHLLNHWSECHILHMNVHHDALFQNYMNGSAPLNRRASRALDKKSFKQHLLLNHWPKFKKKITKLFLIILSTKIAQMATRRWTKGLPDIQTRNTFKRNFLLNHWSKFKIISQNCCSWCFLPKLHKWFGSAEQRGCQSQMSLNEIFFEPLVQIPYIFTWIFPMMPSFKIA